MDRSPLDWNPCVDALVKLGLPGLEPLLTRVADGATDRVTALVAFTIDHMLGQGPAVAVIQHRIGQEREEARRERLRVLARLIQAQSFSAKLD
jgi:hypothetical protein